MTSNNIDKWLLSRRPQGKTYTITADPDCKFCHGSGTVTEYHPYGSTVAGEDLTCECVIEQLPEEFDDSADTVEIETTNWTGGDGPEFEYDDYLDLYQD